MIHPRIQTNADRVDCSFEDTVQITGVVEIELSHEKLTATKTCFHGIILIPNKLTFSFRIDPDANDMELYLGIKPGEPLISRKAYSFIEDDVVTENKLIVSINKEKIAQATLNGRKLADITPYSWEHKVNHFEMHKKVLEDLLGREWFTSDARHKKQHPAYIRWALCKDILEHGLQYPDHIRFLPEITTMILDSYAFVLCSRGDTDRSILGDLSAYGSANVIKRIRSEIVDPDKYGDVMLELTYAAWHISRGHRVQPTDEQGTADFEVVIPGYSLPVYTECKRIRNDTNDSRFGDIIRKANRQIKTSSKGKDCLGLVAIDISDKVEPPREVSDEFPSEVQRLSSVIQGTLKERCTSVSAIVLFWNEFNVLGGPPEQRRSHVALVRRTHLIRHMQPRKTLPDFSVLSEIGNTVEFNIYWRERSN